MKVTVIYSCGSGERIGKDVYVPQLHERVPFAGTGHWGWVNAVRRQPRKIEIDISTADGSGNDVGTRFDKLPGLTP